MPTQQRRWAREAPSPPASVAISRQERLPPCCATSCGDRRYVTPHASVRPSCVTVVARCLCSRFERPLRLRRPRPHRPPPPAGMAATARDGSLIARTISTDVLLFWWCRVSSQADNIDTRVAVRTDNVGVLYLTFRYLRCIIKVPDRYTGNLER